MENLTLSPLSPKTWLSAVCTPATWLNSSLHHWEAVVRPTNLAQAGGKDASQLEAALASVTKWVEGKLS